MTLLQRTVTRPIQPALPVSEVTHYPVTRTQAQLQPPVQEQQHEKMPEVYYLPVKVDLLKRLYTFLKDIDDTVDLGSTEDESQLDELVSELRHALVPTVATSVIARWQCTLCGTQLGIAREVGRAHDDVKCGNCETIFRIHWNEGYPVTIEVL